ncbi:Uncharacterised protein [Vibrio cholerae]|nr:Uncharacterised protein [Vibrio cholerae]
MRRFQCRFHFDDHAVGNHFAGNQCIRLFSI